MMCLFGSSKMAVMARLLAGGGLSQTITEDIRRQKLVVQGTYRELREADEVNLLDEEDMDVFGLMPMTDPLHLVCCNACKKPVKASRYAAHAEMCRSLTSAGEMFDISGGVPPRKDRKRLLTSYSNQAKPSGERPEFMNADDSAALESQLRRQPGLSSSVSKDTQRNSACEDVTSIMGGKGVNPDRPACVMPPPKRIKLVSRQRLPLSDDRETASGLTKTRGTEIPFTRRDLQVQTSGSDTDMAYDHVVICKYPGQKFEHCPMRKHIPVPLATKIYYSQRNNRLRSVVANMYHVASAKGLCCGVGSPETLQESLMQVQVPYQRPPLEEQADELLNKKRETSASKANQILAECSEVCLDISGGLRPTTISANQVPVDNILKAQNAPVGLLRSKYWP